MMRGTHFWPRRASVARTGRLLAVGEAFPWGGVTAEVVTTRQRLETLVAQPTAQPRFIEIKTDRATNAEFHREMRQVVAAAL